MKRLYALIILIILNLIIGGCGQKIEESLCNEPYFEYMKGQCCLDMNNNEICDNDETESSKDVIEESKNTQSPETIARKFANAWEMGYYEQMYNFFTSGAKQKKTLEEFAYILEESKIEGETYSVRLDEINAVDETTVLVYFHVNGYSVFSEELPAFKMVLEDNKWVFDAFALIFNAECVYRPNFRFSECPITTSCNLECAKYGISKSTKDVYTLRIAFPLCTKDLKCECKCIDTASLKDICSPNVIYAAQYKQDLVNSACTEWSESFKNNLNIKFEEYNDRITFQELNGIKLTNVYLLIDVDYGVYIGTINPNEIKVINKKDAKHKETESSFTHKYLNSIYIYSDQGRYFHGYPSGISNFKFTYTPSN